MTIRDIELAKIGNEIAERLEKRGETVRFMDGLVPYGISTHQVNGKIYWKAILIGRDLLNERGSPKWRAKGKISNFLKIGFDQILLVSKNSKTGRKTIVNYNSKGLMFETVKDTAQ